MPSAQKAGVVELKGPTGEPVVLLGAHKLKPIGYVAALGTYMRQLWRRRHFILADARGGAFKATEGTHLGMLWLILKPFGEGLVYFVIFGTLLQTSRGIENFPGFLMIGINFFTVMKSSMKAGESVMKSSQRLMRSSSFPRASVIMSWSLRMFFDFIPVFIATLIFILVMPPHVFPTFTWLLTIPAIGIAFVMSQGIAFITATLTTMLPDLRFVWPLVQRFWFFGSGLFYGVHRFESTPVILAILECNPAWVFLTISRNALLYNSVSTWQEWVYLSVMALLMWMLGLIVFWSQEDRHGVTD